MLKANKLQLEGEKRVREQEADLLLNYAKTLNGEHVTPEKMSHFLESFVEHGRKNLESVTIFTPLSCTGRLDNGSCLVGR